MELVVNEYVKPTGTYCAAWFDRESQQALYDIAVANKVPNIIPMDKFHVTILYSRKHLPGFKSSAQYLSPIMATLGDVHVWESENDTRCLVLTLTCPSLNFLHDYYMREYQATWDYPSYIPHVTLSYDIANYDESTFNVDKSKRVYLTREYAEDLKLNWSEEFI